MFFVFCWFVLLFVFCFLVQVICASSYFCTEDSCNSSPWLLGYVRDLLFLCLLTGALFPSLGYLKWPHSQSSTRNRHNLPWPKLGSEEFPSVLVTYEEEVLPGLLTSPTQGWWQFNPSVQLFRNEGDQVQPQRPPPWPTP